MKKLKVDELVDTITDLCEAACGPTGQHVYRRLRKHLLETAQRWNRSDKIADMIDLHRQDALDVVMAEHRMASKYGFSRFVVWVVIIGMARQPRTEIRIAGSKLSL